MNNHNHNCKQLWGRGGGGNSQKMSVRVKLSKKDKTLSLEKITGEQVFRLQHKETNNL